MMKGTADKQQPSFKEKQHSGKRADNKNNLDHREGEEQDARKDDVTHNKKEHQSANKKNRK